MVSFRASERCFQFHFSFSFITLNSPFSAPSTSQNAIRHPRQMILNVPESSYGGKTWPRRFQQCRTISSGVVGFEFYVFCFSGTYAYQQMWVFCFRTQITPKGNGIHHRKEVRTYIFAYQLTMFLLYFIGTWYIICIYIFAYMHVISVHAYVLQIIYTHS